MKRKLLLFVAVLVIMLAIKYAMGQSEDVSVNWNNPGSLAFSDPFDSARDMAVFLLAAPFLGAGFAYVRMWFRHCSRPFLEPLRLN